MKTSELIAELQRLNPEGDADVLIGNDPVIWVKGPDPGYYDGKCRFVETPNGPFNGYTKAGYRLTMKKLNLVSVDLEDILLENPECEIEWYGRKIEDVLIEEMNAYKYVKGQVEEYRKQGRELEIWSQIKTKFVSGKNNRRGKMSWFHKHDFRILHKSATDIVFACCECGKSQKTEIRCDHEWTVKERTFVAPTGGYRTVRTIEDMASHERLLSGSTSILHECERCHELHQTILKGVPALQAFQ